MRAILADYSHVTDFVWCQEEPQNQGAWYSTRHHYDSVLPSHARLRYAGRPASASPAVGYMSVHAKQQKPWWKTPLPWNERVVDEEGPCRDPLTWNKPAGQEVTRN